MSSHDKGVAKGESLGGRTLSGDATNQEEVREHAPPAITSYTYTYNGTDYDSRMYSCLPRPPPRLLISHRIQTFYNNSFEGKFGGEGASRQKEHGKHACVARISSPGRTFHSGMKPDISFRIECSIRNEKCDELNPE